jgi:hypothetical protein
MTSSFQPFTNVTNQSNQEEGGSGFSSSWSKDAKRSNKSNTEYLTPTNQKPPTFGFQFGSTSATKDMTPNTNVSNHKPFSFDASLSSSSASKNIFSPPVFSSTMATSTTTNSNSSTSGGFHLPNPGFAFDSRVDTMSNATTHHSIHMDQPITSSYRHNIDNLSLDQAASNLGLRRRAPLSVQTTGALHPTTRSTPNKSLPPKQSRLGLRNVNYTSSDALMKNDSTTRPIQEETNTSFFSPNNAIPKTSLLLSSSSSSSPALAQKKIIQYNTWVVVYGVTTKNLSVVLSKFTSLGTVLSKYPSLSEINNGTNWIALEYKSHLEAEKASCQNNSILDLGNGQVVVLGVVPVNEQLALSLKLKNFMELGSTGVERIAMGDGTYEIDDKNTDDDRSGKRKLTAETRVWNEEDVLYKGDDVGKVGKGMRDDDMDDNASMPKNEICDKFMKWVFSW